MVSIQDSSVKEMSTLALTFTSSPFLSLFTVPFETYIANLSTNLAPKTLTYQHIATSALVFSQTPKSRILLLRRSPHDSMPNLWEPPGGAVDPEDVSILSGCARELLEEAGLVARSITHVIDPRGRMFLTRSGKRVGKFEFVVTVGEEDGKGLAEVPEVKLDPNEHVDFVWALEQECVDGRTLRQGEVVQLLFTTEEQRDAVLKAFRILNGQDPGNAVGRKEATISWQ